MKQSPSWEANWFSASQEIPPHFMESEGSLPHSQEPATCLYPGPARSNPCPHIVKSPSDKFNKTFSSVSRVATWGQKDGWAKMWEVSGHIFAPLRCGHAKKAQNIGHTNLLPLNENRELPVVFFLLCMYTTQRGRNLNRRSDAVCLDTRLIISLSMSKGQHSNPLHSADAADWVTHPAAYLHVRKCFMGYIASCCTCSSYYRLFLIYSKCLL